MDEQSIDNLENIPIDIIQDLPSISGLRVRQSYDSGSDSSDSEEASAAPASTNLITLLGTLSNYHDDIDKETTEKPKATPAKQEIEKPAEVPKPKKKTRQYHSKIPTHLKGLMGEANIRFARGDISTAEKMCFELIRQVPNAHEPYLTLAQIYEPFPDKCLLYHAIAAHLRPTNADQWCRLAQLSVEANNLKHAVTYYTRALRINPKNFEVHAKRIQLLESIGDKKSLLKCKIRLAYALDVSQHEVIIQICKEVAQTYYNDNEFTKAIDALNILFEKCPDKVTLDMVNMMLQLLLQKGNYSQCLDIFLEFCNIEIEVILKEDDKIFVVSYNMPQDILIDLHIKFIICLIKLDSFHLVPELINKLIAEDTVETIGDLYLDVAEALMAAKQYVEALKLLVPLVKSKNFSLAAVWLKHAECLNACKLNEQAIESYYMVMKLAPQHVQVRHPLATLLLQENRQEDALKILTQERKNEELDVGVLIKRLQVLKQIGNFEEYCKAAELLLSRHCTIIKHPEEIKAVTFLERPAEKLTRVKNLRTFRGETLDKPPAFSAASEVTVEEEYKVFRDILETCKEKKEYAAMQKFAFVGLSSSKFKSKMWEISLLAFFTCVYNRDTFHGYSLMRDIVVHNKNNHLAWNLFNMLLQRADDIRHNRFMMRLLEKFTEEPALRILEANYALSVGKFRHALEYYKSFFRRFKDDPLFTLIIGVIMLQSSCQQITHGKKLITKSAIQLFLHYVNLRGEEGKQEAYYNLGRMNHFLGINHIAEHYYLKALEYKHSIIDKHSEILDLRKEIAYNLHLLYKNSGHYVKARKVLYENVVI